MKMKNNYPADVAELRKRDESLAIENATHLSEHRAPLLSKAPRQTLHELRSYQIELEMQNEELRRAQVELTQIMLNVSKREQRRIGEDLHDGLGQQLAAIELMCSSLQNDIPASLPDLKGRMAQMTQFLREAIQQVRMLSHDLIEFRLTTHGLPDALAKLAQNISSLGGAQCRFVCPAPVSFNDTAIATQLYHIAQEAVHNAVKHAQASLVTILLTQQNETSLQVSDDGKGLPCLMPPNAGMGLQVMKHRANIIGARLKLESSPGHGVIVTCALQEN